MNCGRKARHFGKCGATGMNENHGLTKNKKILVTGATGFLGSRLLLNLVRKEYNVIILKRTFSNTWRIKDALPQIKSYDIDKIDVERIFNENEIGSIIHLATDYGRKEFDVIQMSKANIELPTELLALGTKYGTDVFVNTHTFAGNKYSLYAAMKSAFLETARFFVANYQLKFINMRLEYMYGERDDYTKFIPFVIKSILEGNEIRATEGEQKRDFIYVQDVVEAYLKVLNNLQDFREEFIDFEIGTGESASLKYFVSKIEDQIGKKANIKWGVLPYGKNEIFDSKASIEKANKYLGWHLKYDMGSGLKETIDWYREDIIKCH